jgi:DNA-binding transcriptional ArsR family regulator
MQNILKKTGEISDILKNFSNKNKLAILCYLGKQEKNVSEIMKCSSISQSQISQYL